MRDFETVRRRLIGFDLAALPELQRRGIPGLTGARSVAVLPQNTLRVSPWAAKRRADAAAALGPRVAQTGEVLPRCCP